MTAPQTISGVTQVYPGSKAKGFDQAGQYPIAWEIMYRNDEAGQAFADDVLKAIHALPAGKGVVMQLDGKAGDSARCLDCAFRDRDSFRQVVNAAFRDRLFYDEVADRLVPKQRLLDAAAKIPCGMAMAL